MIKLKKAFNGIDNEFTMSLKHYNEIQQTCFEGVKKFLDSNLKGASSSMYGSDSMELVFITEQLEIRYKNLEFTIDTNMLDYMVYCQKEIHAYYIQTDLYNKQDNYSKTLKDSTMFNYYDTPMFNFWLKYCNDIIREFKEKFNYMIYSYELGLEEDDEINHDTIQDIYTIAFNEYFA